MFLLGKSHGQRSLAGYSQRGCKESNVTERLSTAHGTAIEFLKVKFRLELSFLNYKTRAALRPHLGNNKSMTYIMCVLIHVRVFVTPWIIVRQAPLSMGFPRKECQIGMLFPPPEDPPHPGVEPVSPALAGGFFTTEPPGEPRCHQNPEF